jgi:hypothetical protein
MYEEFWLVWALAGVTVEGLALWGRKHPGSRATLSENVRWAVLRGPMHRRVSLALWVGFAVWFAKHIWG